MAALGKHVAQPCSVWASGALLQAFSRSHSRRHVWPPQAELITDDVQHKVLMFAAEIINRRCVDFLAGHWESLWDIRPAPQSQAQQASRSQLFSAARSAHYDPAQDAMTRNTRVPGTSFDISMSKIRAGGQLSRATKVLSSNGICADTDDTLASLQALQFPAPHAD